MNVESIDVFFFNLNETMQVTLEIYKKLKFCGLPHLYRQNAYIWDNLLSVKELGENLKL